MKLVLILLICVLLTAPVLVMAQDPNCPPDTPKGTICLKNPLKFNKFEIKTPTELIIYVTEGFTAIIATLAVVFLAFSGFKLMIATNEEAIKSAKSAITWSVGGFALSVLAFTIISGATVLLGFEHVGPDDELNKCGFLNIFGDCAPSRNFTTVAIFILYNILGLVGVVAVIMIMYYGYKYVTSAGNEQTITSAKSGIMWSITGLVIILIAFTIIAGVQNILFDI